MAKAGRALNVSHAAISQQIRHLEAHMGLPLLDRSGRDAVPTDAGRRLANALSRGFGEIAAEVEAMTESAADRPLQISLTPAFAAGWLMPRLADFRANHPQINLMLDPTAEVKPLGHGGIDVALRYGSGAWDGTEAELVVRSPIAIVAAPDLVADHDVTRPEALMNLPWLQELGTNETTEWLNANGVEGQLSKGLTALPGNLLMEAARAGQGVAIIARVFVEPDIAAGRLRLLFEDQRQKGYYLVTRAGQPLRPPARAFVTWLRRQAALTPGA